MTVMSRGAWWKSAPWLALALLALFILVLRLELSFDLSAFFPRKTSLTHEILLEQLKNGPGSRLIVIGIKGEQHDRLAEISEQMREELASNPAFVHVLNGEFADETAGIPEPVKSYYLLLKNVDYSKESLHQALQLRLREMAFGGGKELLDLIARDPFLISVDVLQRLAPVEMSGDIWLAEDGSAVLMAETRATAIDLTAQIDAIRAVTTAFAKMSGSMPLELEVTGVGAFGVELQQTIRAEAKKRSILAVSAILLVLLLVYRKPRYLLLATLPIGMGFLVGLALLALLFDSVHGITLAFGFTLLGIAVDYPIHVFSHSKQCSGSAAIERIWPTMRLGASSTAVAYLAISMSGSQGLAQLGLFTASGVIVAALVTRMWLPVMLANHDETHIGPGAERHCSTVVYWPAFLILGLALMTAYQLSEGEPWNDSLASLSPVPEQRLLTDRSLRSAAGTPDMRYQLVLHASSLESLLLENEAADVLLERAVDDGLLDGWQSPSRLLPSQQLQLQRQDAIPDKAILRELLDGAISDTPFRSEAFAPFEASLSSAKFLPPLLPSHFEETPLSSWLDSHLIQLGDQWVSLISLNDPKPEELAARVAEWGPKFELVDLQQASVNLMRDYRNGAVKTISVASLLIIVLLLLQKREARKILWIASTVTAALAVTVALILLIHAKLTFIHLVALLLVLGLGLDYALFLSRSESASERKATRQAVLVCAISTSLAFGVLAGSSIPVLKFLGLTVACGSAASLMLAFTGSMLGRRSSG
jgi:predicted exporter